MIGLEYTLYNWLFLDRNSFLALQFIYCFHACLHVFFVWIQCRSYLWILMKCPLPIRSRCWSSRSRSCFRGPARSCRGSLRLSLVFRWWSRRSFHQFQSVDCRHRRAAGTCCFWSSRLVFWLGICTVSRWNCLPISFCGSSMLPWPNLQMSQSNPIG